MIQVRLVGIDCATQDQKTGVAYGELRDGRLTVENAFLCSKEESAALRIVRWLSKPPLTLDSVTPILIALDAPLGWPKTLSQVLGNHRAGEELSVDANSMFRRKTDLFIKQKTGKTPLDVGANRIARTAYAALRLLGVIGTELNLNEIPLAWEPMLTSPLSAIEVYPAATLIQRGYVASGYKKKLQHDTREKIVARLGTTVNYDDEVSKKMLSSADALDAVVCLLAAVDFLEGRAMPPEDMASAEIEGWIWVAASGSF
jgi:predicted RNase H-like nuclease